MKKSAMKKAYATPILQRLARRAGVKVNVEPKYKHAGQVILPSGRKLYFRSTCFDINPLGASEIAKDKDYASYFLKKQGYSVIPGEAFFSDRWGRIIGAPRRDITAAYRYARRLGFPVIVKPNSLSQGAGVNLVRNKREFFKAVRLICRKDRIFLVQRVAVGEDYRIVVLGDKVISAYRRLPLQVTGDGRSSIVELLAKKQRLFNRQGRDTVIKQKDPRITKNLRYQKLTRRSVLPTGRTIALLENRNLSTGGESEDVTRIIHPSFKKLAINITCDMGLKYCGVDLMVQGDITKPCRRYKVIEINAAPGIDNYARAGREQQKIVEDMYLQVLLEMKKLG